MVSETIGIHLDRLVVRTLRCDWYTVYTIQCITDHRVRLELYRYTIKQ